MVRAPCCEKMGLKRGPWTAEEDRILIGYVNHYGHGNWRALPKQAGLLRCGKSCRLRWTNYLRPDIKRGNFSKEEEETIIKLHEILGNRWSAIAARLPGRTDNEIKNVWHTHLKKRLHQQNKQTTTLETNPPPYSIKIPKHDQVTENEPQHYASDTSSAATTTTMATTSDTATTTNNESLINSFHHEMDEDFWAGVFSDDNSSVTSSFPAAGAGAGAGADPLVEFQFSPLYGMENGCGYSSSVHDGNNHGVDFWFDLFTTAGELPEF